MAKTIFQKKQDKYFSERTNRDILFGAIALIISFLIMLTYYEFWGADFNVHLAGYRGDSIGLLTELKNCIRGGNYHKNVINCAPFESDYRNIIADYGFMLPSAKVMYYIFGNIEAAINAQAIFNGLLLTLFMFAVCIKLNMSRYMSLVCSVMYANMAYFVLGYNVIMMIYVFCFYIPLFFYYIIKIMNSDKNINILGLMVTMFLLGFSSLYYAFFGIFILAFVLLYTLLISKSTKAVLQVLISLIFTGYGIGACICPNILHSMKLDNIWNSGMYYWICAGFGGILVWLVRQIYKRVSDIITLKIIYILFGIVVLIGVILFEIIKRNTDFVGTYAGRTLYAVELGSLNIMNLILPSPNNILISLDKLIAILTDIDDPTKADSTQTGLLVGIGFIYSIFCVYSYKERKLEEDKILRACGVLNIFMIVLSIKGGLASVIAALVTTGIRNYNRMMAFVAVSSLISFGLMVDRIYKNILSEKKLTYIKYIGVAFVILMVLISVPTSFKYNNNYGVQNYETRKKEQKEWYELIDKIEDLLTDGSKIYVLPIKKDDTHIGELMTEGLAYEKSIPAILGKKTVWGSKVSLDYDLKNETMEYIDELEEAGYGGIYLDAVMYADDEYKDDVDSICKYLGTPDVVDNVQRRYFWRIDNEN